MISQTFIFFHVTVAAILQDGYLVPKQNNVLLWLDLQQLIFFPMHFSYHCNSRLNFNGIDLTAIYFFFKQQLQQSYK